MINTKSIAQKVLNIIGQMHELRRPRVVPTEGALSSVLEEVFWSSVDRYEGNPLRVRIYFAPQQALSHERIVQLGAPLPLSRDTIRKLSPAHPPDGALLVVEDSTAGLQIVAILGSSPFARGGSPAWLCVECRGPAAIRVCIGWQAILEFTRGKLKLLGGMSFDRTTAQYILARALGPTEPATHALHVSSLLLDIGTAIERQGTGGALWVLPSGMSMAGDLKGLGYPIEMSQDWCEPYREMWEMRTLMITSASLSKSTGNWFWQVAQEWDLQRQDAITRSISMSAMVDGAIVVNGSPQVLAFGVICNRFSVSASRVLQLTDPQDLSISNEVDASDFGGSRHRSAIDFCLNQSPACAVVASHDGGITIFASWEQARVVGSRVSLISSDVEVQAQ